MGKVLNDWLFAAMASSALLMSICTLQPAHPLAIVTRTLGYGLAMLCLPMGMAALWLRRRRSSE